VYLVKHKADKDATYALKSISKASIIEQNLEKHILQEKAVLELVHFPFIMEFVRTFKDDISVYFLVQYIRGMELFDVRIHQITRLYER
jgi:cGMP-dependent protein kinase